MQFDQKNVVAEAKQTYQNSLRVTVTQFNQWIKQNRVQKYIFPTPRVPDLLDVCYLCIYNIYLSMVCVMGRGSKLDSAE